MASINMPQSAKAQLIPIKTVHRGKHGATVFAILKNKPNQEHRALKIITKSKLGFVTKAFFDNLKAIQGQTGHPLTRVYEHDADLTWYTMSWVKGYHVSYLLGNHYTNGFPPFLLFRVLDQVFHAEQHLQKNGLCHVNLRNGENIMLRAGGHVMPYITLIDYSAVETYTVNKAGQGLEEFIMLARRMTRGETKVPDYFRRVRGGGPFKDVPLAEADWFYKYIAHWKWDGKQTLDGWWEGSEDQIGTRLMADVSELKDDGMVTEVMEFLKMPKVSEEEIATGKVSGGLDVIEEE
ncbi:hypothetical protein HBI26_168120 [Parastagonospora nodorum]|nr:hypothetical protein HBI26_168120 [Parastagonospora nodorum]